MRTLSWPRSKTSFKRRKSVFCERRPTYRRSWRHTKRARRNSRGRLLNCRNKCSGWQISMARSGKNRSGRSSAFRPLARRHVPIIAVTNLKGGVGKTTLTANLGAMFSRTKRVLLVDLDYQGSMTSMCLSAEQIEELRCRKEFVQRLFESAEPKPDLLLAAAMRCPGSPTFACWLPTRIWRTWRIGRWWRWLLNPENGDVRQILRAYLHDSALTGKFDYILLDCPPRLTTACINVLAAADFVLIPVIPDRTSSEAVPRHSGPRKLRQVVCPRFHVLGLIANRTSPREEMIKREKDLWDSLGILAKDAWEGDVYQFRTVIRQKAAFAEEARDNRFAAFHREVEAMFRDLTTEVEERIIFHERQGSSSTFCTVLANR